MPLCIVIGGPNGSGKTTFAHEYLPREAGVVRFINTDDIAKGLKPEEAPLGTRIAARIALRKMHDAVRAGVDFAIESTLSGLTHAYLFGKWREAGYRIELAYLRLNSVELAIHRVAARVAQGGHGVPEDAIRRRVGRSWRNFNGIYKRIADDWWVFDASTQDLLDAKGGERTFHGWKL